MNGSCCGCISTSITHKAVSTEYGHRVTVLADRCLLEPFGRDRCKITYISRIDLRYCFIFINVWLFLLCTCSVNDESVPHPLN